MAEKSTFFSYKGKPLVRCGDVIYYGDMKDKFVVKLMSTDPDISQRKAIIKTGEKPNLFLALDLGCVWLQKSLKNS